MKLIAGRSAFKSCQARWLYSSHVCMVQPNTVVQLTVMRHAHNYIAIIMTGPHLCAAVSQSRATSRTTGQEGLYISQSLPVARSVKHSEPVAHKTCRRQSCDQARTQGGGGGVQPPPPLGSENALGVG